MIAAANQTLAAADIDMPIGRVIADPGYCSEDNLAAVGAGDLDRATQPGGRLRDLHPALRARPPHADRHLGAPALGHRERRALRAGRDPRPGRLDDPNRRRTTDLSQPENLHRLADSDFIARPAEPPPSAPTADSTCSRSIESAVHKRANQQRRSPG
jgi:hypothetical protein